ncbi:MAG: hypothetical protein WCA19_24070 [Candidatus Acidiferrales bacterium]
MTLGLSDTDFGGVYRDGNLLIITRNGTLPPVCIQCAKPIEQEPFHRKYSWHPFFIYFLFPFKYLLPFGGDKLYELIAGYAGEELEIEVYICPKHRANQVLMALAQLAVSAIGLLVFIFGLGVANDWTILIGLLLIPASNIGASVLPQRLRPIYINESHGTFKGAGEAFLDQLKTKPPGVMIRV